MTVAADYVETGHGVDLMPANTVQPSQPQPVQHARHSAGLQQTNADTREELSNDVPFDNVRSQTMTRNTISSQISANAGSGNAGSGNVGSGESQRHNNDSGQSGCQSLLEYDDQGNVTPDDGEIEGMTLVLERVVEENNEDGGDGQIDILMNQEIPAEKEKEATEERAEEQPKPLSRQRQSVKAQQLESEFTFQQSDVKLMTSKTQINIIPEGKESWISNDTESYANTYGRQTHTTTVADEFEGYAYGVIKTGSMHKKRKSKRNVEPAYQATGYGCCATFSRQESRKTKKSARI